MRRYLFMSFVFFFVLFNRVRIIIYSCRQTRFGIARRSAVARKLIYTTCTFDGGESPFPLGTSPTPLVRVVIFPAPLSPSARHTHTFIPAASPRFRTGPPPTYYRAGELARCPRSARPRVYPPPPYTHTNSSFEPSQHRKGRVEWPHDQFNLLTVVRRHLFIIFQIFH